MGFSVEQWQRRLQSRSDTSGYVYHLTKDELNSDGEIILPTMTRLVKILKERKLNGSDAKGYITGNRKAVCFQDAPITGIVQNVSHENMYRKELGGITRYTYAGLCFPKSYVYRNGGRPVMYEQKDIAKKILPPDEHWRIVDYNLTDVHTLVDWTHEREWRMPTDEFHFDLSKVSIVIPNPDCYRYLIEHLSDEDFKSLEGIIQVGPIIH